jgi:hypothetical protein
MMIKKGIGSELYRRLMIMSDTWICRYCDSEVPNNVDFEEHHCDEEQLRARIEDLEDNRMTHNREEYPLPDEAMKVVGHDNAIIGVAERQSQIPVIAYDKEQVIHNLMSDDEMTRQEAIEYFEFNIAGAWVGEGTPVFISLFERDK